MDKNHYCIIMAGGVGSRFWPMSRAERPKQFLDILGTGHTLLEMTFDDNALVRHPDLAQVRHGQTLSECPFNSKYPDRPILSIRYVVRALIAADSDSDISPLLV